MSAFPRMRAIYENGEEVLGALSLPTDMLDSDRFRLILNPEQVVNATEPLKPLPIKQGTFAEVWAAWDNERRGFAVVKIPREDGPYQTSSNQQNANEAALNEAIGWSAGGNALQPIIEKDNQGRWFNAMPMVDGTLDSILANAAELQKPQYRPGIQLQEAAGHEILPSGMPLPFVIDFALQLARGLRTLHNESGVVHADIKEGNIGYLLTGDWREKQLELILMDKGNNVPIKGFDKGEGSLMGHRYTRAPELWHPGNHAHVSTDMYAWASQVLKMANGKQPLEEELNHIRETGKDERLHMVETYTLSTNSGVVRNIETVSIPFREAARSLPEEFRVPIIDAALDPSSTSEKVIGSLHLAIERYNARIQNQRFLDSGLARLHRGIAKWGPPLLAPISIGFIMIGGDVAGRSWAGERDDSFAEAVYETAETSQLEFVVDHTTDATVSITPDAVMDTPLLYTRNVFYQMVEQEQGSDLARSINERVLAMNRGDRLMNRFDSRKMPKDDTAYHDITELAFAYATQADERIDLDELALRLTVGNQKMYRAQRETEGSSFDELVTATYNNERVISADEERFARNLIRELSGHFQDRVRYEGGSNER